MNNEKREILKKLEVGTTYSGVDVICRQYEEIERQKGIIRQLDIKNLELTTTLKESREYIKDKYAIILADDLFLDHDEKIERKRLLEILEILDKVNNNE